MVEERVSLLLLQQPDDVLNEGGGCEGCFNDSQQPGELMSRRSTVVCGDDDGGDKDVVGMGTRWSTDGQTGSDL